MTDEGKFIGIIGTLIIVLLTLGAEYTYAQEFLARSALPVEMQTAEMIQSTMPAKLFCSLSLSEIFLFSSVSALP